MLDSFLLLLIQLGGVSIIIGIIGFPVGLLVSYFKKSLIAEWLIKGAVYLIIIGVICLALAASIGGVGVFNA